MCVNEYACLLTRMRKCTDEYESSSFTGCNIRRMVREINSTQNIAVILKRSLCLKRERRPITHHSHTVPLQRNMMVPWYTPMMPPCRICSSVKDRECMKVPLISIQSLAMNCEAVDVSVGEDDSACADAAEA